jgi:photoactive yellow protein
VETIEDQILGLSETQLDDLPQGIIRLDAAGTILYYNQAQADKLAEFARRTTSVIGLNFFDDVAPCTAVKDFQGRFDDFVSKPGTRITPFKFLFRLSHGSLSATITMVRRANTQDGVYIVVTMSPAPLQG